MGRVLLVPFLAALLQAPVAERARSILPQDGAVEKVASGFQFTEGPVWNRNGTLLFTDIPNNRIVRYSPPTGAVGDHRNPSGRANGLALDAEGRLVACEGNSTDGGRRVSRTERDGRAATLADRYAGRRLNSPNDLALDAQGRIYFTDPRYGDRKGVEQDREAVYRIDRDGTITRVVDDVQRPNGIALSPDGKTLYLADNHSDPRGNRTLIAYDVAPDGGLKRRRVLHDFAPGRGVDGMKVDARGNVYATAGTGAKAGVYVFSPAGEQLAFIPTPEDPTNCAFGGADLATLYITAGKSLYRIRLEARGLALPPRPGR